MYHPVWILYHKSNNIDRGLEFGIENNDNNILWILKTRNDILYLYRCENIFFEKFKVK